MRWFTLPTVSRTGKLQPLDGAKILQMSSASILVATVSWEKRKKQYSESALCLYVGVGHSARTKRVGFGKAINYMNNAI